MIEQLLSRRKFNRFCAALGSSLPATSAIAALSSALETSEAIGAGSNGPTRAVRLRDGAIVPALGLGSARLAQGRHPEAIEEEALRTGLSLGMTLIDTAEVYSNGHSEELIGRVVAGQRDNVFLVSKVWPSHVAGNGIARACEASLARLGTDHLDLYLLHWPNGIIDDLSRIVAGFESLRAAGKIRAWGVSNFTVSDMENLFRVPHGDRCATNQVLYHGLGTTAQCDRGSHQMDVHNQKGPRQNGPRLSQSSGQLRLRFKESKPLCRGTSLLAEINRTGRLLPPQGPGKVLNLSAAIRVFVLKEVLARVPQPQHPPSNPAQQSIIQVGQRVGSQGRKLFEKFLRDVNMLQAQQQLEAGTDG
jgi:Aldo/keto reductase family